MAFNRLLTCRIARIRTSVQEVVPRGELQDDKFVLLGFKRVGAQVRQPMDYPQSWLCRLVIPASADSALWMTRWPSSRVCYVDAVNLVCFGTQFAASARR